jgi:hypothetical protein
MILKCSSIDWQAGDFAKQQVIYRIEVMSQLRSVREHVDTVRMALSKNENAWEGTKVYQDEVMMNAQHGRRSDRPQEMRWTDKKIISYLEKVGLHPVPRRPS